MLFIVDSKKENKLHNLLCELFSGFFRLQFEQNYNVINHTKYFFAKLLKKTCWNKNIKRLAVARIRSLSDSLKLDPFRISLSDQVKFNPPPDAVLGQTAKAFLILD